MRKPVSLLSESVWVCGLLLLSATSAFPAAPAPGPSLIATGATELVSAVLPSSRSVQVGSPATAFATIINTGQTTAVSCTILPLTSVPADFVFRATDPATNQVTGAPNGPVDIPAGGAQTFVIAFTPTAPFPPTDVQLSFACANRTPAPIQSGLNTLLLSASSSPVLDVVALSATTSNDGVVSIGSASPTGAFSLATVDVGAAGQVVVSADTGGVGLPLRLTLCQTNAVTGQCVSPITSSLSVTMPAGSALTFATFIDATGNVSFDPAGNRIFMRFTDLAGVIRGATSVAVRAVIPNNGIDGLQPGQWYQVPNSKLSSVLPNPLPPGNPVNIMGAWSGGAYDTTRDRLIVWGGGHADYAGNEIYTFDLNTLTWSRPWGPSPNIPNPLGAPCTIVYADGNPVSRHTYDGLQYAPNIDKFWIQGGSLACGGGGAGNDTWTFDFTTLAWTQKSNIPQTMLGLTSAYDPVTGHIFAQSSTSFFEYDPIKNTWTKRGDIGASLLEDRVRTAAIDPVNRRFVAMGDGDFFVWDLNTFQFSRPSTSGATQIQNGRAPGFVYDPVSKQLIAWAGGATVYGLDTQSWTWTPYAPAVSNTVIPTVPTATGTYGRFQYIPSKNVFIGVNRIDEDVYIYRLAQGQVSLPVKQWIALPSPAPWSTQGMPSTMKHVTSAHHPPSGRIYLNGGDYPGPTSNGGSVGTVQSYRQETWSLSIVERFASPSNPGAGWRLEYPYCGPVGQIQPKHPDYTGLAWDAKRRTFYMVPGVMEIVTDGNCPGESADKVDNSGFVHNKMMTFDPATQRWGIFGSGNAGDSTDTWMSVLDPVTDTLIRFGVDLKVSIFDIKNQTWSSFGMPDNANLWKEYLAADIPGRVIYAIDGLLGNLWRYNIDARTFDNLGPVPGGALGLTNGTYVAWDSLHRVLFWHKEGSAFYAYHPESKSWETLPITTNIPGVNATGRLSIYDPAQNVLFLYGGTGNPQPYLFFYRYGP